MTALTGAVSTSTRRVGPRSFPACPRPRPHDVLVVDQLRPLLDEGGEADGFEARPIVGYERDGRISPLTGAKAMCAPLVGRSCEFGTDASLEGGAVLIKTGRPALGFG